MESSSVFDKIIGVVLNILGKFGSDNSLGLHIHDIKTNGISAVHKKLTAALAIAVAVPLVMLVRLIQPLVTVRFGRLSSSRIGHFAANPEVYLSEKNAGLHGGKFIDIFYHSSPICNQQLKTMWDRTLRVYNLANRIDQVNHWLPRYTQHEIPWREDGDIDINGVLSKTPPHLEFNVEEETRGRTELLDNGIGNNDRFICFHARDAAYLSTALPRNRPNAWQYHNYRDTDIQNYVPAVDALTKRGYYGLRMGAIVEKMLTAENPKIIDYSTRFRTDFLDVFLSAKCEFFICASDGMAALPMIFRRPIVWVDYIPTSLVPTWSSDDLIIPKKLWIKRKERLMTFREMVDSGVSHFQRTGQYEELGIQIIDNTPEEITAVSLEMDARLNGSWHDSPIDQELQDQFWSILKPSMAANVFYSRIGTDFLRNNRDLLG